MTLRDPPIGRPQGVVEPVDSRFFYEQEETMFARSMLWAGIIIGAGIGCAGSSHPQEKSPGWLLRGEEIEGCECESVCPCVWEKDVTFQECRSVLVWQVAQGHFGATDLSGTAFAVALTHSGKNIVQSMGSWEGTIYIDARASEPQKKAIVSILSGKWGKAFSKVDVRSAPIDFRKDGDRRTAMVGEVAVLRISGIKGSDGRVPAIENPPFAIIPKLYCAKAETHTFNDGVTKWDFSGRNGFYGPFEYSAEVN